MTEIQSIAVYGATEKVTADTQKPISGLFETFFREKRLVKEKSILLINVRNKRPSLFQKRLLMLFF